MTLDEIYLIQDALVIRMNNTEKEMRKVERNPRKGTTGKEKHMTAEQALSAFGSE